MEEEKPIAVQTGGQPEGPPPKTPEQMQLELSQIGGPTAFVNRYVVQTYPDGGVRVTFLEQFSADSSVPAVFRTSVFMHPGMAISLANAILASLGATPPSIQINNP